MKVRSLVFISLALASVSAHAAFTRLVTLGDSLNDTGNVYGISGGAQPPAPYWNGRFSNGPIWVEGLANTLGLSATAAVGGGTNFAWGGAELNPNSPNSTLGTPNLGTQIQQIQLAGLTLSASDLVIVSGGGNDFFNGATNPVQVAGWLTGHMQSLYNLGARNFLVPNLPPLGFTPGYLGGANQAGANALSLGFNAALAGNLAAFRGANAGSTVLELNIQQLFQDVLANPAGYGFTNVTQNYIVNGAGANADQWLFFDNVHPTRAGHALVAQRAAQLVPEPSAGVVVAMGLALLARRRRVNVG
ncbi:MAG: SGNH/GDSL hydrolase family protein [Chthonomonas sp.]|nr:SGNH/GDSL hydrolase family protein [Chthonomonas sp.]